ncbi:structural maintenance of chromosomes [Raphidocelis subcapitata]|uniref:Structural maintenance of chromosomes n=1 Tax=Raphidocelis subcapitata TaxID=307507 RepID=A0A2V0NZ79_9CHLO|nr:structural maintenance of chromosomes [Raphidocelis subcapitata]|eukprot:GBF90900.1 structural maintenance of chromosomes [Raphidocelis subcapitata]
MAEEPSLAEPSLEEGKVYVGRSVRKLFLTPGTTRWDWYTGTVEFVWFNRKLNEICYRVSYEDSDEEDLGWATLKDHMICSRTGQAPAEARYHNARRVKCEREDGGNPVDQGRGAGGRRPAAKQPRRSTADDGAAGGGARGRPGSAGRRKQRGRAEEEEQDEVKEEEEEEEEEDGEGDSDMDEAAEEAPAPRSSKRRAAPTQRRVRKAVTAAAAAAGGDEPDGAASGEEAGRGRRRPAGRQRGGAGKGGGGNGAGGGEAGGQGEEEEGMDQAELEQEFGDDDSDGGGDGDGGLDENARIERAVARLAEARGDGRVREEGLAGHVKSVKLQNFMCHVNFEMEFSSHVNFISGTNGSGKSAVLQALQICLGATARETGRGRNLRELIRTGADAATLQVAIWNTGEDAYQPARLGRWVTIERKIVKSSADAGGVSSTWRVLHASGRKIDGATRKNLIEPLLEHLNIAADNPLCVMTQDKTREFLCSAAESKRLMYRLFMDATLMGEFKAKLNKTQGMVVQMGDKVDEIKGAYESKVGELSQLRARLEKLRRNQDLEVRREELELAAAWAVVREREEELAKVDAWLANASNTKRQRLQDQLSELDEGIGKLTEEQQQLREQQEKQNAVAQEVLEGLERLKGTYKAAQREARELERAHRTAKHAQEETQQEMAQMVESIAQATQQSGGNERSTELLRQVQAQEAEMTQLSSQLDQLEAKIADAAAARDREAERQQQLEGELQQLLTRSRGAQHTLSSLESQRNDLQAASGNRLAVFGGQGTVALAALVQQNIRRFEQPPIGPVGSFLSLTDDRWKTAAESVLGPHMEKWIVHSRKDEKLLQSMQDQLNMRRGILCKRFNLPPYVVPPAVAASVKAPYIALRDLVVIDHPNRALIDKVLMDLAHYEKVVVAETPSLARNVTYNRALGPHISSAVAVDGLKCGRGGPGQVATTQAFRSAHPPRLGCDVASSLREIEAALATERSKMQQLQQRISELQSQVDASKRAQQQAHTAVRNYTAQRNNVQGRAHQLAQQTQALSLAPPEENDDSDEMQARLNTLRGQVAASQVVVGERQAELSEARAREASALKLYEERKEQAEAAAGDIARATDELQRIGDQLAERQEKRGAIAARIDGLEASLADAEAGREELARQIEEKRARALELCTEEEGSAALANADARMRAQYRAAIEKRAAKDRGLSAEERAARVEKELQESAVKLDIDTIDRMHQAVERAIQAALSDAGGSLMELEAHEERLAAAVGADERLVGNVRDVHRRTKSALQRRKRGYDSLFNSVQQSVSQRFMGYMQRRKHKGKVRIYEAAQELKLLVKMNDSGKDNDEGGRASKPVQDLKQLSGGERSYTSVAFMLALGEYVEAPFRCMDEYDVFMDAVNRRVATETLLEFALDKGTVQHIFLTPQDISAIQDARKHLEERRKRPLGEGFIKVMRMEPARPGN